MFTKRLLHLHTYTHLHIAYTTNIVDVMEHKILLRFGQIQYDVRISYLTRLLVFRIAQNYSE